jgi:hypothetical protein
LTDQKKLQTVTLEALGMRSARRIALVLTVALVLAVAAKAQTPFQLKDGDRVVFCGDSITDQRLYTTFTET